MAADDAPRDWSTTEEDELFQRANLHPSETGLPMTVFVSPRGDARHDVRVKVSAVSGGKVILRDASVVGVRPEPQLLHGDLSGPDLQSVSTWITLNRDVLIDYWEERALTSELMARLRRLPS